VEGESLLVRRTHAACFKLIPLAGVNFASISQDGLPWPSRLIGNISDFARASAGRPKRTSLFIDEQGLDIVIGGRTVS
jgi:hypothetical protein